MSGNRNYNTRNTGRYNTPGQFVPATAATTAEEPPIQQNFTGIPQQQQSNFAPMPQQDIEMKPEQAAPTPRAGEDARPFWMRNKLTGVKKISNKERRRRQNETLRRLLSPKNALMVLNEMMPGEQLTNQFTVEPSAPKGFYGPPLGQAGFEAALTLEGQNYKGFGDTKITARNAAAEQAIRDIIIKRMNKALAADDGASNGAGAEAEAAGEEGDEEALPMLQLASFALHKLFAEWEYLGHKVPQLRPPGTPLAETKAEAVAVAEALVVKPTKPKTLKAKEVPPHAAQMHPCMLLTYMRPALEYKSLGVDGERPPALTFTMGVEVDGATYIGKAGSKKEARKMAAAAACRALFGVEFAPPGAPLPPHA